MDSFLKGGEVMYELQLDDVRWKSLVAAARAMGVSPSVIDQFAGQLSGVNRYDENSPGPKHAGE
jgi:LmbE family N-acetylglucosaminyl deacetylase